jgi:carboxymethylenebutenolidase
LPGVAPTGRRIEVPTVAIVRFENGKIAREHIYWDQASVLVQAGLIGTEGLPIAGGAVAAKVKDPTLPSNALIRSVSQGL